jgi:MFS family permease
VKAGRPLDLHAALRLTNGATFLLNSAGALFLLFPVYLQEIGSSAGQIGIVAGLLRASSLVARPLGGRLLDRVGRRPIISVGAGLTVLGILSLFVSPRVSLAFLLMRIVQGVGTSLVDSGMGAVVADLSPRVSRARIFAIYSVFVCLASAVMPGLGEVIVRHAGYFPLFAAAAAVTVGGAALVHQLPETARGAGESSQSPRGLVASGGPLLLGGLLLGLAYGVLSVFVPVTRIASGPGRTGLFFFVYFAALIAMRLASGLGPPWLARPQVLLPAYGVIVLGLAALPTGSSVLLLVLVGLACGASHGVAVPVLFSLLLYQVKPNQRGWAVALLAAAFDLGNVVGTVGLGFVGEYLGIRAIFGLAAAIVALGALAGHLWGRR